LKVHLKGRNGNVMIQCVAKLWVKSQHLSYFEFTHSVGRIGCLQLQKNMARLCSQQVTWLSRKFPSNEIERLHLTMLFHHQIITMYYCIRAVVT
jgi:hypothetical protein